MKYSKPAWMAVMIAVAAITASTSALAQTKAIEGWRPMQQEPDPAKRVPQAAPVAGEDGGAAGQAQPQQQPQPQPAPQAYDAQPYEARYSDEAQPQAAVYEDGRGGFFLGVKGGKGWVYEDIDQSAREINAGYRWQAGAVTLIGIELARGKLGSTTDDGFRFPAVDYGSIGVNARFNFGRTSPVYGLVRAGYWSAEEDANYGMDVDGGYFGLGLGVDVNRHFNLSLTYTNYVYFDDYYSDWSYEDINRADTVMFGAEVRF